MGRKERSLFIKQVFYGRSKRDFHRFSGVGGWGWVGAEVKGLDTGSAELSSSCDCLQMLVFGWLEIEGGGGIAGRCRDLNTSTVNPKIVFMPVQRER